MRTYLVQRHFHVTSDIRVGIFINRQGSRRVLNKHIGQSHVHLAQVVPDGLENIVGDEVTSPGGCRDANFFLKPHHLGRSRWHVVIVVAGRTASAVARGGAQEG